MIKEQLYILRKTTVNNEQKLFSYIEAVCTGTSIKQSENPELPFFSITKSAVFMLCTEKKEAKTFTKKEAIKIKNIANRFKIIKS